jgi:uncharacterized damage-inducible protein DinB
MPGMPGPVADERAGLLAFLAHQRYVLRIAAHGLTDEQAVAAPSVSALTVGGLIKHCAITERGWIATMQGNPNTDVSSYLSSFALEPGETLADVLALSDQVARETEEAIAAEPDLGRPVPVPQGVPWFPPEVEAWSVRWVLLHIIEEVARHAGHADIVRESVDGATAIPLMAAVEGWPATPWVQPWQPAQAAPAS